MASVLTSTVSHRSRLPYFPTQEPMRGDVQKVVENGLPPNFGSIPKLLPRFSVTTRNESRDNRYTSLLRSSISSYNFPDLTSYISSRDTRTSIMIRTALRPAAVSRNIAAIQQARFASSLVYLEHKGGKLNDSSLSAVTAAKKVDGNVRLLLQNPRS